MKKFFNTFLTVFAIVFAIPSFLILISWNSLPGEFLYPLKTSLEDVALAITVRTPIASAFSINFTQRRFSEANRLLAKNGSTLGYTLLVAEASQSKEIILGQADRAKAVELSAKIKEYRKNIAEKKLALQSQPQTILPPTSEQERVCIQLLTPAKNPATGECREFPTPCDVPSGWTKVPACEVVSTPSSTSAPTAPTPTPVTSTEPVDDIVEDLEDTDEQLEEIEDELEEEIESLPEGIQQQPTPESQRHKDNGRPDRREDKPSDEQPQED